MKTDIPPLKNLLNVGVAADIVCQDVRGPILVCEIKGGGTLISKFETQLFTQCLGALRKMRLVHGLIMDEQKAILYRCERHPDVRMVTYTETGVYEYGKPDMLEKEIIRMAKELGHLLYDRLNLQCNPNETEK